MPATCLRLIGQLMLDLMRLVRAPRDGPWRDVTGHIFHIGATALPITALVGFLIGVVLAYLTSQQLRQFGAEIYHRQHPGSVADPRARAGAGGRADRGALGLGHHRADRRDARHRGARRHARHGHRAGFPSGDAARAWPWRWPCR
jgi:hypothetical protein